MVEEQEESQPLASQQDNVLVRLDGEDSSDDDDEEDDSHNNNVGIPEKHGKATPTKSVLDSDEEDFETEDDEGKDVAPVTLKEISIFNLLDFHLQMTIKDPKWRMQHWEASVVCRLLATYCAV